VLFISGSLRVHKEANERRSKYTPKAIGYYPLVLSSFFLFDMQRFRLMRWVLVPSFNVEQLYEEAQRQPLAAPLAAVGTETSAGTAPPQQTADVRRRAVE
jgi:hypothetical protein